MSCLYDVRLEVCFNFHTSEAFKGNFRRYKGTFRGKEVHTAVFPSIRNQEASQMIKPEIRCKSGGPCPFSFPVLSYLWHLRAACQCPDFFIPFPCYGPCEHIYPTLAWDVDFSYCQAGFWTETAMNEKQMRKHFVHLPIMGRYATVYQRQAIKCHTPGHSTVP